MASILTSDRITHLAASGLVLDVATLLLSGPTGQVVIKAGPYVVLKAVLRRPGVIVPVRELIELSWSDPALEPADAERAIRARVARARAAMVEVGVPARRLRSIRELGYRMDGPPQVVRVFTQAQATELDRLIANHPAFAAPRIAA